MKAHSNNFRELSKNEDPRYLATGLESLYKDGLRHVPDYFNDLNAMHEAEKTLTAKQQNAYIDHLCGAPREDIYQCWSSAVFATATQRAEAFLKAIGKWEDDCPQCGGSGRYCSEAQARLPDPLYQKCDFCGGEGRSHKPREDDK